jgi:hypothetical protein
VARRKIIAWAVLVWGLLGAYGGALAEPAPSPSKARVEAALQNILALERPGRRGFATVWDGNKYVQCGRQDDGGLRCEAAGALLQSSLARVLTPERVATLDRLGWKLDPSFGNYAHNFPKDFPLSQIADKILEVLAQGYDADLARLDVQTAWVTSDPCPPRNGPSQNPAGMVNDARAMASTAIYDCAYIPGRDAGPGAPAESTAELINFYGARVAAELQRLRVNVERPRLFTVFEAGIGYVQCRPRTAPPALYCEAQSADSWPALGSVLTPARIEQLHAVGYADPGRGPNYWKLYRLDQTDDATVGREVLTVLHDVYGYNGVPDLKIKTEEVRP